MLTTALRYRGPDVITTPPSGTLHDSEEAGVSPLVSSSNIRAYSQSWQSGSSPTEVTGIGFDIQKVGRAYGLLRGGIYAHTGTYGVDSRPSTQPPNGDALVISRWYAISSVSGTQGWVYFPLSGWTPTGSTNYCVVLELTDHHTIGTGNVLRVYGSASDVHGGNRATRSYEDGSQGWSFLNDLNFRIYYASGGGDVTAPTLSSPTGIKDGVYAGDGTVTTDEGNGTLYWVVTTSSSSPSVAQVQAGQDHLGATAVDFGSFGVSSSGLLEVSADGLDPNTEYFFHYQHTDAADNDSTVASSSGFTTDSLPVGIHLIIQDNIIDIIGIN